MNKVDKNGLKISLALYDFINNEAIGGCDDLYELENANKLDSLLN